MKRAAHKQKPEPSTSSPLELLHMDLCGPMRTQSLGGNKYVLIIVDDYSRYTWVKFLRSKDETPGVLITFLKTTQVKMQRPVQFLRTDNGTKFKNKIVDEYLESIGISHQYSVDRTPEQNGVVERESLNKFSAKADEGIFIGYSSTSTAYRVYLKKSKTVVDSVNVTFNEDLASDQISSEPIITGVLASGQISPEPVSTAKNSDNASTSTSHLTDLDLLFEFFYDEFLGTNTEAHIPTSTPTVEDAQANVEPEVTVSVGYNTLSTQQPESAVPTDTSATETSTAKPPLVIQTEDSESGFLDDDHIQNSYTPLPHEHRWSKEHPLHQVIGDLNKPVQTRSAILNQCMYDSFLSKIEPTRVFEALADSDWVSAMQEEINQFEALKIQKTRKFFVERASFKLKNAQVHQQTRKIHLQNAQVTEERASKACEFTIKRANERGNTILSARDMAVLYMPEIPKMEAELDKLKNQNSKLLNQIQEFKSKLSNSDKTHDCIKCANLDKSDFADVIKERAKEIKDKENQIEMKEKIIEVKEKIIMQKERKITNLQSQLKMTEQTSSESQDESVKLQQKFKAFEDQIYVLEKKNVELIKSIKEDEVKEKLQSQLKTTEQKSYELKDESVKLQNKLKASEDQISILEKKNVELSKSIQEDKEKSNLEKSYTQKISELSKKADQEKKNIELRCIKLSKQVSDFEKVLITERDTFAKERKVLENKNTELPKQISTLQDLLEKERNIFKEKKQSFEQEKKLFEKKNATIFKDISEKNKNLETDFESDLKKKFDTLISERNILSEKIKNLEAANVNLSEKISADMINQSPVGLSTESVCSFKTASSSNHDKNGSSDEEKKKDKASASTSNAKRNSAYKGKSFDNPDMFYSTNHLIRVAQKKICCSYCGSHDFIRTRTSKYKFLTSKYYNLELGLQCQRQWLLNTSV
ncbi:hypothetical protein L6452_25910 [Arctium lappa]|uniref:Uncharacterized protein n=1 Tax=Arctium lappa TaxID=4217 RepID=A0ACB9AC35_ARCLA|nr:hypothetical protein L6452_25910 [Arctium lappa]